VLDLLPAPGRSFGLVVRTLGELFVQDLNLQGKKPDEARSEHLLKSDEMFVRDLGATGLHVGEHLAAYIHPFALQACRHEFLAQTQFMALFGQEGADDVQAFHNASFSSQPGKPGRKPFPSDF